MSAPESIAHYRITGKLGQGGMGEVAIRVLPANFAEDPGRMARFQREAKVLASTISPRGA